MTQLVLRLLLLTLLGVWTALPAGPVRAMASSALCCDNRAMAHADHSAQQAAVSHGAMHDKSHAQICALHCLPLDAARSADLPSPGKAHGSRIVASMADVSLSSRDFAPTSPPPRS
ncbi:MULTISPECIES: hypothetical protein [unclassified Salipiger]|uniref:hypothetical protein n=1 Tax=unclassified Salipiger TaxID=2640570 RepID=UPI0013B7C7A7|nr:MULTISPECIES: hypothetical protein [unclassified Salipiger]NDV51382.1 hypothetical protein [Salipiger sp. PrR003]NDW32975.1 hypothetical protein [Salipiger sp. PrR007]